MIRFLAILFMVAGSLWAYGLDGKDFNKLSFSEKEQLINSDEISYQTFNHHQLDEAQAIRFFDLFFDSAEEIYYLWKNNPDIEYRLGDWWIENHSLVFWKGKPIALYGVAVSKVTHNCSEMIEDCLDGFLKEPFHVDFGGWRLWRNDNDMVYFE